MCLVLFMFFFSLTFLWRRQQEENFYVRYFGQLTTPLDLLNFFQGHLFKRVGKQLAAVMLCSVGWEKSPGMIVSLVFGFRYVDEFNRDSCP